MQFESEGQTITLVGDASLVRSRISLKAMLRTLTKENEGYFIELNVVERTKYGVAEGSDQGTDVPSFFAASC